jgi:hypothetical protein
MRASVYLSIQDSLEGMSSRSSGGIPGKLLYMSNLKGSSLENSSNLMATTSQDFKHIGQKMNQGKPRTAYQGIGHPQVVPMKANTAAIGCVFR